jgi:hypothetical protein
MTLTIIFFNSQAMMPTQESKSKDQDEQARQQRKPAIVRHVINLLGQPQDLHQVQVRHLWGDRYRVNVLLGPDSASVKVGHSYFLVADQEGNVLTSTPQIVRQYQL